MKTTTGMSRARMQGVLLAFAPTPILLTLPQSSLVGSVEWRVGLAALCSTLYLLCGLALFRRPKAAKVAGAVGVLGTYGVILPFLATNPFAALAGSICLIYCSAALIRFDVAQAIQAPNPTAWRLERARWAILSAPLAAIVCFSLAPAQEVRALGCAAAACFIAEGLLLYWAMRVKAWKRLIAAVLLILSLGYLSFIISLQALALFIAFSCVGMLLLLPDPQPRLRDAEEKWWQLLVNNPGRILITTFFLLCFFGSLCLALPFSTTRASLPFIDSVFTAVSAVCVTGLIVLDTPKDFTFTGQVVILLLIQLGGLGMMSITTVALHALGRRLSLKHEKLLTTIANTSHQDLFKSLSLILKFTFTVEALGALALFLSFLFLGDSVAQALWKGVFTSISAFCNAGFALQSDNLIPYQKNALILHTVALLIILGGIAPATSLMLPRWLTGKKTPIAAKIALTVTAVLLASGTIFILIFEWNGILSGLSLVDKAHNAWFQAVTLRTAGFNSVDLSGISGPTFLIMLMLMFIGGSPGGTAGGIKTTSIGILTLTFWTSIINHNQIVIQHRRIHAATVHQAVTVALAGAAIWFLVVMMLETTQSLAARSLIFEATSALGTVGLSIGATPLLDPIGKVIIIIAMFVGRIGPISLFMLLNEEEPTDEIHYPVERVSIL